MSVKKRTDKSKPWIRRSGATRAGLPIYLVSDPSQLIHVTHEKNLATEIVGFAMEYPCILHVNIRRPSGRSTVAAISVASEDVFRTLAEVWDAIWETAHSAGWDYAYEGFLECSFLDETVPDDIYELTSQLGDALQSMTRRWASGKRARRSHGDLRKMFVPQKTRGAR